jgi:hypothetical protein
MKSLRAALSDRNDSYWELLATAAGDAESIERTETGLRVEALTQGAGGPAVAPSIVSERVEALAAFNPARIVKLATKWQAPKQIGDNPWWHAAWLTSLRHLRAQGAIERGQVDCPALFAETALLWDEPFEREISWRRFSEELKSSKLRYEICRSAARGEIAEKSLSARDLEDVPWQMLRLLRGRARLLDQSAVDLLIDRARNWTNRDPLEMALVAEICADLSPTTNGWMAEEMISIIPSTSDPRDLTPIAYTLLGGWHPP